MAARQRGPVVLAEADIAIVGVDMSSQTTDTAACVLAIAGDRLAVDWRKNVRDDELLPLLQAPNAFTGIDAPFGWPLPFSAFADAWSRGAERAVPAWARLEARGWGELAEVLKFRAADRFVRLYLRGLHQPPEDYGSRWPDGFSVSADKLALPALRTMRLLAAAGVEDLTGQSARVVEVYPGPTLAAWDLSGEGYKGARTRNKTDTAAYVQRKKTAKHLVDLLRATTPFKTDTDELDGLEVEAAKTDHVLDALVCALTAWAARVGHTYAANGTAAARFWREPLERAGGTSEAERRALVDDGRDPGDVLAAEGWIHHPVDEPGDFLIEDPRVRIPSTQ